MNFTQSYGKRKKLCCYSQGCSVVGRHCLGVPCLLPSRNRSLLSYEFQTEDENINDSEWRPPPLISTTKILDLLLKHKRIQVFNTSLQSSTWPKLSDLSHLIPLSLLTPFQPHSSSITQVNSYLRAFARNMPFAATTSDAHRPHCWPHWNIDSNVTSS